MNEFEQFLKVLRQACLRPGLYTGNGSYASIAYWIWGVDMGWNLAKGSSPLRLGDFSNWLSRRYLIFGPAWNWCNLILHVAGSEARAFEMLPELFEEFAREAPGLDSLELYEDLKRTLIERFGTAHHQPESSVTEDLKIAELVEGRS